MCVRSIALPNSLLHIPDTLLTILDVLICCSGLVVLELDSVVLSFHLQLMESDPHRSSRVLQALELGDRLDSLLLRINVLYCNFLSNARVIMSVFHFEMVSANLSHTSSIASVLAYKFPQLTLFRKHAAATQSFISNSDIHQCTSKHAQWPISLNPDRFGAFSSTSSLG